MTDDINKSSENTKTYCFDIDGTICTNTWGEYDKAEVIEKRVIEINNLYDIGHEIILFTARGTTTKIDWRKLTESQMKKWGVKYHKLILGKPQADYYIDDKGLSIFEWKKKYKDIQKESIKEEEQNKTNDNIIKDSKYLNILYDEVRRPKTDYPAKLAKFLKDTHYKQTGKIIDLGCGRGDLVKAFYNEGFDVVGSDLSPSTKNAIKPHKFVLADLESESLAIEDNHFDFVFSKSVIEHLRNPIPFLKESIRILKPSGCSIIMTPSWPHHRWGPFYLDFTHVTPFTKPSLRDAMLMAGYENVKVINFYQLPFLWKYKYMTLWIKIFSKLPLRYRPMYDTNLPLKLNNLIRFSKEVMLLGIGNKPTS